ncbi:efflux RND transporter periplasmic adaptor subunit [candidate division KSB1 bacterium]|nr:efflux RND transporter periplasmic adaptor subunit [candidate division KSB1 bacterium]
MNKRLILLLTGLVVLAGSAYLFYPKLFPAKKKAREVAYWTDPMIPGFKSPTPGKSPMGMEMIPVYADSQMAETETMEAHAEHEGHGQENEIDYYTCTMHPSVKSKEPGKCPICSMDLVPVMKKAKVDTGKVDLTFSVSPVKQQLIGVKFSTAEVVPLHKTIRAVGRVDYDERKLAVVNLKISGWIKDLLVDYTGQFVGKGQPLFTIYSPELVSTQEEYLQARRALQSLPMAAMSMDNRQQTSSPPTTYINPQEVLNTAKQRLLLWDLTEAQIAELEQRGQPETYLTIYSPINGHVIEKMALKGMHVEPGMRLYKFADLSTVWVYADVYEYELLHVKVGQSATITLSYLPGETFEGRITYVFPYLNMNTRTARVRIELPNRDGKLKPEMYAEVEIFVDLGNKLAIPESAVLNTGVRQIVFVDKGDGIFEVRFVQLGARAKGLYEITEGLQAGERVVSYANFLIDAESKVQGVLQRLEQ